MQSFLVQERQKKIEILSAFISGILSQPIASSLMSLTVQINNIILHSTIANVHSDNGLMTLIYHDHIILNF